MSENVGMSRTISTDPGLLSPEELLKSHSGGRRRTLEELIARSQHVSDDEDLLPWHRRCRDNVKWFLDNARLKISVSGNVLIIADFLF